MKLITILLVLTSLNTFAFDETNVVKNFSHRFNAYTIAPDNDLDESEKERLIRKKVSQSKSSILKKANKACTKYENTSGWDIKKWEANDLGWISGEGEVQATFSCVVRKPSGGCYKLRCSPGCYVYGGRCCIDKYCPIY
jgi:hypothetical protein